MQWQKVRTRRFYYHLCRRTRIVARSSSKIAATQLIEYLRKIEFATRTHAFVELLWHTGMRLGAARGLDLEDYDSKEQYVELRHRPEQGTRLKNKEEGDRYVSLSSEVCYALDAYIKYNRDRVADSHSRKPLFTSRNGRPAEPTLRDYIYRITRPCQYTGGCPHDREMESCEALEPDKASTCSSSVSPHAICRGAITHHLSRDVPEKIVSDRMNVSLDLLEKHYDRRGEQQKAQQRRGRFDNV